MVQGDRLSRELPFFLATCGSGWLVSMLFVFGVQPCWCDASGWLVSKDECGSDRLGSPLVYALLNDKASTISYLSEKVAGLCNQTDTLGNSPLLISCCVSAKPVARELLRAGADVNRVNNLVTV